MLRGLGSRDLIGRTRRRLASEELAEPVRLDARLKELSSSTLASVDRPDTGRSTDQR
jgi:hypothetical protein